MQKNRKENIEALFARAETTLMQIEKEYQSSLTKQSIVSNLKIDIKNFSENLRSILDYLAHDIVQKHCPNAKSSNNVYFPIVKDLKKFQEKIKQSYPELESNIKDLYDYLLSIQPFQKKENEWLALFNHLNNENKHNALVEQKRTETKRIVVNTTNSVVSWKPSSVKFGSGVSIGGVPVNPQTQIPMPHPSQTVQVITWVDFQFEGINVSALWLLKESFKGIKNIYLNIGKWI